MTDVYKVASKLIKENPEMKSYEALAEAKKIINERKE